MPKGASLCLLFLSSLIFSCSGTLVGFSYHERGDTATSTSSGTISFLQRSKVSLSQIRTSVTDHRILSTITNSKVSVDFYLNKSLVENFTTSKPSGISGLKAHLLSFLPHANIKSIIASCGSECLDQNEMPLFLHALKSTHSVLRELHIGRKVKVSVAFPLSLLKNLNASHENNIHRILSFIKEIKSFVMIEDNIEGESSIGDHFVQSIIQRATLAASVLPCKDVPMVLKIKSQVMPSSIEVAQFSERVSKYLEARTHVTKRIAALYAEVQTTQEFAKEELKNLEILTGSYKRRTLDDTNSPTNTIFPSNPPSSTPIITPPDTPTIITVPSTNPVTISPTNPAAMPVTVSPTTPMLTPPTNPANSPVPVSNPATTGTPPPVTTSNPPPSPSVPVMNPQPPPASTNAPATQGQSWCVAKTGAPEASLQAALDYACGMGGADCSQIQQGGSCYSPVTLQNHASFAFNSYYQKNPAPTSCDFGGTATIVNTNPSTGSCIFPSSSSSSTPKSSSSPTPPTPSSSTTPPPSPLTPSPSIPTTPPFQTAPPTPSIPTAPPTTSSSSGGAGGTLGYGTPPSVLNSSNPASGTMPGFGSESPPVVNTTSASHSVSLRPFLGCIVLIVSFVTTKLTLHP